MALRTFSGITPSFFGQPAPLFDDDDFLSLTGTATRPWQNRFSHLSINSGGLCVWGGRYPTVSCRNFIINSMLGAHVNAFANGQITTYRNVTWRDAILSSFTVPPAVNPPPQWIPVDHVPIASRNYPTYPLRFDRMWPCNVDLHVMTMWSLTDRGPVVMMTRPNTHIPTMVMTAMLSYVGVSATHLAIQAYVYAGQLPQPPDDVQTLAYQWLACVLYGSLTGALHRNRTMDGFYFAFPKATDNQDDVTLRWNDGARVAVPANPITRYIACGSPHWQQSMLHNSFALLAQSTSALRPMISLIDSRNLPPFAAAVQGVTGQGPGTRDLERYNYVQLNLARHLRWEADGLITNQQRQAYDVATNAQAVNFMDHLIAMEAAHPIANGRIVVQPYAQPDINGVFETGQVIASADVMFP
ncbi:VP6 [Hirame aquareovirus]|nr:VP6 [Hirame aquareovirus]